IDFFSGTFAVNGGTLAGTGQHRVNGGILQVNLNLGPPAIALSITNGSVDIASAMTFQVNSLNFTGGTVNGPGTLRAFGGSIGNTSTTTLANGATLTLAGSAFSYNGDATNHLVINDTSKFNNESGSSLSITTDGAITGAGTAAVTNSGTFNGNVLANISFSPAFTNAGNANFLSAEIAFQNGYSQTAGTTTINGGTFSTITPASFTGGVLRGVGTINASITNNGATVQPGFSPGILTIAGNYSQSPTGTLNIELGGTAPGSGYDRLAVTGSATLAGTVNVTLISGFTLSGGDIFDVVTYGSHSGIFSPENLPPFPSGTFSSMYTPSVYKLLATVPVASDPAVT